MQKLKKKSKSSKLMLSTETVQVLQDKGLSQDVPVGGGFTWFCGWSNHHVRVRALKV